MKQNNSNDEKKKCNKWRQNKKEDKARIKGEQCLYQKESDCRRLEIMGWVRI